MGLLRFIFFWYWAFCLALLGRRDDDFTLFEAVVRLPHPGSTFPRGRYRAVAPLVVGVRSYPPDSKCGGGGGGGRRLLAPVRLPAFSRLAPEWAASFAHSSVPPFRCRLAAGNAGGGGQSTGGAWRAAALAAAVVSPPRMQRPPSGGCGAAISPACLCPPMGWGGGERGGSPGPLTPPPQRPQGGGLVVLAPGGQPPTWGSHSSPASLYPLGAGPSCRPSLGPPDPLAVAARCRLAGGGGGAVSAWGGGSDQRSAGSGLCGSGPPLALVAPVLRPTGGGARASVVLYGGGGVGRGAWLCRGGRPAALSHSHPLSPIAWANGARPSPASPLV